MNQYCMYGLYCIDDTEKIVIVANIYIFTLRCLTEIMAACNKIARCQNDVVHVVHVVQQLENEMM